MPITETAAWHARYGSEGTAPDLRMEPVIASLLAHRSVRRYSAQLVAAAVLQTAVAAAQSASSSSNLQAWSVIAVHDAERRQRLAALAGGQAHIEQAPVFLAWVLDLSRLRRQGEVRGEPTAGLDYLESFLIGAVDTALAAQNAVVALEWQGLGVVYIGGMRNHPEQVAEELGLPAETFVLFGMCVGYPDPEHAAGITPRLPQPAILHHERYDAANEATHIAEYERRLQITRLAQGRASSSWSQVSVHRVGSPEALTGRDRLREALLGMGFKLR